MAGNAAGATFRITDPLDPSEEELWKDSEREYATRIRDAVRRRDDGNREPYTEDQLQTTIAMVDALRKEKLQPEQCRGDLSGSAPPIFVDGDLPGTADDERRTDEEYCTQMAAARPRGDQIIRASDWALDNVADPFASLCLPVIPKVVRDVLRQADVCLRRLLLSETTHASLRDFQIATGTLMLVASEGPDDGVVVLGLYAAYGITCRLRQPGWILMAYAFTGPEGARSIRVQ